MFWVAFHALAFSYWYDTRIHELGNTGMKGTIHATLAPLSTAIIDRVAYGGTDVRRLIKEQHIPENSKTVDFCCGVGYSTSKVGVDTSKPMLRVAKALHPKQSFHHGNSETWGETNAFDISTCMFGLHEIPSHGRYSVLSNMLRVASTAIIVDIASTYAPSDRMLVGEPYLLEYLKNIEDDIDTISNQQNTSTNKFEIVPGRVAMWKLTRNDAASI